MSSTARNCKSLGYLCRSIGRCERAGRKTLLTATSLLFFDVFPTSGVVHAFSVGGWMTVPRRQEHPRSLSWRTTTTLSPTNRGPDSRFLATTRAEDEANSNAASKMNPIPNNNLTSSFTDDDVEEKSWPTKGGASNNPMKQQSPVVNGDTNKPSTNIDGNATTAHEIGLGQQQQIVVNGDFEQQQPPPPPSAPHQVNITEISNLGGGGGGGGGGAGRPLDILDAQTAATASSSILAIDPKIIDIVPVDSSTTTSSSSTSTQTKTPSFVKMFRGSANYIANHRNTLAVYHIPGELLEWKGFPKLMDDIALTWLLGMKIVLVMGCRHQIDVRLNRDHTEHMAEVHRSIRVTDMETLRVVKEEAGYVRFEAERHLARALRSRVSNTKNELDGNVVSGNFYSAQPFGVIDGIDYQYTGFPRRVEIEKIRQVHDSNDIVLLTTLGVSPSGEVFNVNSESLAATVAGSLDASKVIYFTIQGTAFRNRVSNKIVQNLRISDAKKLLEHYHVRMHNKGFASIVPTTTSSSTTHTPGEEIEETRTKYTPAVIETLLKVGWAMSALERGVKRAHIIAPTNGALLQELYTRDGSGTLISGDLYEGIRRADVNDVAGIYDLISPLVQAGTLVERPKNVMEKDILSYYVYTRDNLIVATGQLKRFEGKYAEIGCLVVSKEYRSQGRGDAMLGYLERLCLQSGATKVFVLSTQTMEWFVERGFREVDVRELPPSRREIYNHDRRSKIYMKQIDGDRDLDASELWWNR